MAALGAPPGPERVPPGPKRLPYHELLVLIDREVKRLWPRYRMRIPARLVARGVGLSRQQLYDNLVFHEVGDWATVRLHSLRRLGLIGDKT